MHYIGDDVKQKVITASPGTVIFFEAPVGSGKTTFCIRQLWDNCRIHQKKMLLCVNRSALRGQLKQEIFKKLNIKGIPEEEEKLLELDGLTVTSYQYLQQIFKNNLNPSAIKIGAVEAFKFDFVIADEIHYLLVDSLFSPMTEYMKCFPNAFPNSVRIYISATFQPVRSLLMQIENVCDLYEACRSDRDRELLLYRYEQTGLLAMLAKGSGRSAKREVKEIRAAEADYSYLIPILYEEETCLDCLIRRCMEAGDDGKWLVFVRSKSEGSKLKTQIKKAGITVAFVTADDGSVQCPMEEEDRKELSSVLKQGKFQSQVLLATSVIDNGISVIDPKVTHLVVTGYEMIQAVQQAGRIRVKGNKRKIELYICRHTAEYFNRCQYQLREKLRICKIFENSNQQEQQNYLIQKQDNLWQDVALKSTDGRLFVNSLARPALEYFLGELEDNKRRLRENPDGFVLKVLGWFGLPYNLEDDLLEKRRRQAVSDLESFLLKNAQKAMKGEAWIFFKTELRRLYEDSARIKLCSGRADRVPGTTVIKEILESYGYVLNVKKGVYLITGGGI